ncbi:MAG TPA: PAS domain S-box protein [Microvirga sp.]|nr:PAS domain S-box protein [Microvirga sp.]
MTLDTMDQGLLLVDPNGRVVVFNRRLLELLDLPYELLARRPLFEEVRQYQIEQGDYPPHPDPVMSSVLSAGPEGGAMRHERIRPNGTVLEIRTVPIPGGGAVRTFTDITALKRAETEARETAATLRVTLENMDQGLMMVNQDDIVQVYNTRAARLLDLPLEMLESRPALKDIRRYQLEKNEFAKSDDQFRSWVATSGVRDERDVYERERPDGTVLEVRTVPLADGGAVRTYADITSRRTAEQALQHSEERFRSLVDATNAIVWTTDGDGAIVTENPSWERFTGQTEAEYRSWGWIEAIHPEDRPRTAEVWKAALTARSYYECEYRIRRNDGEYRRTVARGVPLLNTDGTLREWVGANADITEQRNAEERARTVTEAVPAMVFSCDQEGRNDYTNRLYQTFTGLSAEELLGEGWMRVLHPDDHARTLSIWEEAKRNRSPYEVEYRLRAADGSYRWCLTRAVALQNTSGGVERWLGACMDIHSQTLAEEAVRESEERLRLAIETTGLGTYDVDVTTGLTRWSEEFQALLGVQAEEPESRSERREAFSAALHPEDRERVLGNYDRAVRQRATHSTDEFRIVRGDTGETRWVAGSARYLYDDAGKLYRVVGTLRDITVRKSAELALQESEARYRLLAENATDVIFRTGLDGRRLYLSPSARDIYGYEPGELLGSDATFLIHPDDAPRMKADLEATIAGELGHEATVFRIRHKVGHWVWLESRRRLVRDETGAPVEVVGIVRDISERVRLEERLRQSQKMEAVGQLTGGVAHDFNNLLTVILGNTEILAEEVQDAHHKVLAGMALQAAERGAHLTQQLLSFARRQSLRIEPLRLDEVVDGMLGLLKRTLGEQVEVRTRAEERHSRVLVDRGLLESALLNLALNARDAMPGGGALTLRTGERVATPADGDIPAGQPVAYVTVSDNGTGIAPEVLAHVFEPFFTTKEVGKGSGLGLAMVYGFAQQSGGHVSLESAVGEGTSVTIVLPVMASEPAGQEESSQEKVAAVPPTKKRILLVEDEPQVLQFVTAQLVSLGYEVTAVATGRDALDLLEEGVCFELLFTDIVLPQGMSGVELARRAAFICPELRVLLTSGYSEEMFEQHGRPPEKVPLLRKPYRRKDLLEALAQAFSSERG